MEQDRFRDQILQSLEEERAKNAREKNMKNEYAN